MTRKFRLIMQTVLLTASLMQAASASTIQLKLEPHRSQCIENSYAFTINATCTIKANAKSNKIRFNVTKNSGTINGKTLKSGQSTSISVTNQDQVIVHAEPDTKVTIDNLSDSAVQASCSV